MQAQSVPASFSCILLHIKLLAYLIPIMLWGKARVFFEKFNKVVYISDAAFVGHLLNWLCRQPEQHKAVVNAGLIYKTCQCTAVFPVKQIGEIAAVYIQPICNAFQTQIRGKVVLHQGDSLSHIVRVSAERMLFYKLAVASYHVVLKIKALLYGSQIFYLQGVA